MMKTIRAILLSLGVGGCGDNINNYYSSDAGKLQPEMSDGAPYGSLPNFLVSNIQVIDYKTKESSMANVQMQVLIANNGYLSAGLVDTILRFSGGEATETVSLKPGESKNLDFLVTMPLGSIVEFRAAVDPYNEILEFHEDDNKKCVDLYNTECPPEGSDYSQLADLVIQNINLEAAPTPLRASYEIIVKNAGLRPTYIPTYLRVEIETEIEYSCPDDNYDLEEVEERTYEVPPLREQESFLTTDQATLPINPENCVVDEEEVCVRVTVDSQTGVVESEEKNNRGSRCGDITDLL